MLETLSRKPTSTKELPFGKVLNYYQQKISGFDVTGYRTLEIEATSSIIYIYTKYSVYSLHLRFFYFLVCTPINK